MEGRSLSSVDAIDAMRARAYRRLPKAIFDVIEGGATDEITLRENRLAFNRIWLRPRALAQARSADSSTTILGQPVSMPLMLAPCGFARMANSEAELAVARAAGRAGTAFALSGSSSYPAEDVAAAATGPLWYQPPLPFERDDARRVLERAWGLGYRVLCLLIDTAVNPKRERDFRNRLSVPLSVSPKLLWMGLANPAWTKDFVLGRVGHRGAARPFMGARTAYWRLATTVRNMRPVTLDDLRWMRELWRGNLVVKGVSRAEECGQMLKVGVDGIVVSNHGGRNLDGIRPTIEILPEVVAEVGGRVEVFVDGGVRRGTDVVKAIALGARGCLVGRPYLYGLAAQGEAGVDRVLRIFRHDIREAMLLLGSAAVGEITRDLVASRDVPGGAEPS